MYEPKVSFGCGLVSGGLAGLSDMISPHSSNCFAGPRRGLLVITYWSAPEESELPFPLRQHFVEKTREGWCRSFGPAAGGFTVLARPGRLFRARLAHRTHGAQIPLNLHRQRLSLRRSALFCLGAGSGISARCCCFKTQQLGTLQEASCIIRNEFPMGSFARR